VIFQQLTYSAQRQQEGEGQEELPLPSGEPVLTFVAKILYGESSRSSLA
jgi:hypothetical protein